MYNPTKIMPFSTLNGQSNNVINPKSNLVQFNITKWFKKTSEMD